MIAMHRTVGLLRILLVLLFAGLVVAQVFIMPGTLAHMAETEPELAHLRWPLLAFFVVEFLCVQVVIVCTWRLLSMVKADVIFSEHAFRWVNAIVAALGAAWVLLFGVSVYLGVQSEDPGLPVILFGMLLAAGVVVLLMVVMRALLRQAAALRSDMEAVI